MSPPRRPLSVLIVEDSDSDAELISEALATWKHPPAVTEVKDGEQAIRLLTGAAANLPDLIFLDLNLPKHDGMDVLRAIKTTPLLAAIPVIVLTTSERERDIRAAYGLHANAYLTKPIEFDLFVERLQAVETFWGLHARLPQSQTPSLSSV